MNPFPWPSGFTPRQTKPCSLPRSLSFEDGFEAAAQFGQQNMGRAMMAKVIERLVAARVKYFERMNAMH
jgi:hypothetical protein